MFQILPESETGQPDSTGVLLHPGGGLGIVLPSVPEVRKWGEHFSFSLKKKKRKNAKLDFGSPGTVDFRDLCPLGPGRGDSDGDTGDRDYDECAMMGDLVCGGGRCVNVDGGYRCECPEGYALDSRGENKRGLSPQTLFSY